MQRDFNNLPDQGEEDEEDTDEHPGRDGRHSLHVGGVGGDDVEDIDEHEEEGDEHRHAAGDHLGGDQEANLDWKMYISKLSNDPAVQNLPKRRPQKGQRAGSRCRGTSACFSSGASQYLGNVAKHIS